LSKRAKHKRLNRPSDVFQIEWTKFFEVEIESVAYVIAH
jgi:hypothetical protein